VRNDASGHAIAIPPHRHREGLDGGDKVFRAISYRLVRALLLQARRGTISSSGKVRGFLSSALIGLRPKGDA
jgi:hypothetical protein